MFFFVASSFAWKHWKGLTDDDFVIWQRLSTFTRKIGTCEHDDIMPRGPKGVSSFLLNYNEVFTFSENGAQYYRCYDVNFKDKPQNVNKTSGEPKMYHFNYQEDYMPYKDEIFTYRSAIVNSPLTLEEFNQTFRTVFYGIRWETWQDQQEMIRDAINRELSDPRYYEIRQLFFEFVDGLNGKFKLDGHDYTVNEEDVDEPDDE